MQNNAYALRSHVTTGSMTQLEEEGILAGFTSIAIMLGAAAACLVGFSKTGVPGAAIPAIALMAEAFHDNTNLSVGALLPVLLLGDLFAILYYRRHTQWSRLVELAPYVAVGMLPGYLVLWKIEPQSLRVLIGITILVLLMLYLGKQRCGWRQLPNRWWFTAAAGILAGFGTAMGNAAGPVMSIYLVSKGLDKHEFLGTSAWFFFLVNLSKLPFFTAIGVITKETLTFDLIVGPVLVVGAVFGAYVARRLPQSVFDALVVGLTGFAALRLILS